MFVFVFVLICGSSFIHRFVELGGKNETPPPPPPPPLLFYLFIFVFKVFGKFSSPVWNFFSSP